MQTKSSTSDVASATKLNARLSANSNASRDFDEWCFRQLPALPLPSRILDLGCGNGKQVKLFAPMLSPSSEFVGIDLSADSLKLLQESYRGRAKLELIEGSFDQMEKYPELGHESFDLIYASYALYYTKDLSSLIPAIYQRLKPGGVFWVIAPYYGTNHEFLDIIRPLHEVEPFMDYVFDEFHQEVIAHAESAGFAELKPAMLRNKIRFPDAGAFLRYLSNSLFYRPGHDPAILEAVHQVVTEQGHFSVSKNIISLQFKK